MEHHYHYKIEPYNGNPADFPEFLSEYYLTMQAYNHNDDTMIKRLVLYLKGSAREIYLAIMSNDCPPQEWTELKNALETKILTGDPQRVFRQAFYERKQKLNENVIEFAYNIRTLAERAFGVQQNWNLVTKAIVKDQWWAGIKQNIKNALILYTGDDFDDLVEKARLIEINLSHLNSVNTFKNDNKSKKDLLCFICQQAGHVSKNCPKNKKVAIKDEKPLQSMLRQPSQNNQGNVNNMKCTKCSRTNHWTKDCRARNLQCTKCGKLGHIELVCRTTNINPNRINNVSPVQRPQVRIDGQIRCFNCGQYGHVQRSCPKLNTKISCNENEEEAAMTYIEKLQEALRQEYKKLNNDELEIQVIQDIDPSTIKLYEKDIVDLLQILQKWQNSNKITGDIHHIYRILRDPRLKDHNDVVLKILKKLELNWSEYASIYNIKIEPPEGGSFIIAVFNNTPICEVLKEIQCKIQRDIIITYMGEKLDSTLNTGESGLLPEWDNVIKIKYKPEKVIDMAHECKYKELNNQEIEYIHQIPNTIQQELSRAVINSKKMKAILNEVVKLAIPVKILSMVVTKLRELNEHILPFQEEVYSILQKYGEYIRQHKKKFNKGLKMQIDMPDGQIIFQNFELMTKVKTLRDYVQSKLQSPILIHIELFGRKLDDDEFLIDCGCDPKIINSIKALYMFKNNDEIDQKSEENWQNMINNEKMEILVQNENDAVRRILESPSFFVRDLNQSTEELKEMSQIDIVQQIAKEIDDSQNEEENHELKSIVSTLLKGLNPSLSLASYHKLDELVNKMKEIQTKIKSVIQENTHEMINSLFKDTVSKGKCIAGLTIIIQHALNEIHKDPHELNEVVSTTAKQLELYVMPHIMELGGLDQLTTSNISPIIKNIPMSRLILLVSLVLCLIKPNLGITVYDCSKPKFGHIYSLLDTQECANVVPTSISNKIETYNIYQEAEFYRTTIRECRVKVAIFQYHCGVHSHASIITANILPKEIPTMAEDCEAAFRTNKLRIDDRLYLTAHPNKLVRETITRGKIDPDGSCNGRTIMVRGQEVKQVVDIEDYQVELLSYEGTFDSKNGQLLTNPRCSMKKDHCVTQETTLLYKPNTGECDMRFLKNTVFTVISGHQPYPNRDEYVKIPNDYNKVQKRSKPIEEKDTPTVLVTREREELIRLIKKDSKIKCGAVVYETNYKGIYVTTNTLEKAKEKDATNIKLAMYVNAKMDYLYHDLQRQLREVYQEVVINDCKLAQEIIRNRLLIAVNNPELASPFLLQEGVFGRILGEALYTYQCHKEYVSIASYNQCTSDLPVVYEQKLRFASPITRILLDINVIPKKSVCGPIISPLYKISDQWISLPDRKPPREIVQRIDGITLQNLIEFKPLKSINDGGIYSMEDIEQARRTILFPQVQERGIIDIITRVYNEKSGKMDYNLLFGADHYMKAARNILSYFWGGFTTFGTWVAGFSGIYFIIQIIKGIGSSVISGKSIHQIWGCSWRLLLAICPPITNRELHKKHRKDIEKIKSNHNELHKKSKTNDYFKLQNIEVPENNKSGAELTETGWKDWMQWYSTTKDDLDIYANTKKYRDFDMRPVNSKDCPTAPAIPSFKNDEPSQIKRSQSIQNLKRSFYPTNELEQFKVKETGRISNSRILQLGIPHTTTTCSMFSSTEQRNEIRPMVNIRLNKTKVIALIDTGAQSTLVDSRILTPVEKERVVKTQIAVLGVDGNRMPLLGTLDCSIKILDKKINHTVKIMENNVHECILGMDFLSKIKGLQIDLSSKKLICGKISTKYHKVEFNNAILNEYTIIPSRNEQICLVTTDITDEINVLFEPNELLEDEHLFILPSVAKVKNGLIPIRLINLDIKPRVMYPGTNMGKVEVYIIDEHKELKVRKLYEPLEVKTTTLTQKQQQKFTALLWKYEEIFAKHEFDIGTSNILQHKIDLTSTNPIKQRPYRVPHALQGECNRQVDEWLKHGIIQHSASPWLSPLLLVKKKGGEWRICVDYRKINAITNKDNYPLPLIDEMFDKLGKATIFSTIDLQTGYMNIEVEENSRPITAFSTEKGLFEFIKMPFGLTGAPATFQRSMNLMLIDLEHAMVYIDDIIVFSENFETHLEDVEKVFKRIKMSGFKVKPPKCEWGKTKVKYVGHIISQNGIEPDPEIINKVKDCKPPNSIKQLQSFLGLANYYRKFIHGFAEIAFPLNKIIRKDLLFLWGTEQQNAFELLKQKLITTPILRYPDINKPYKLMTDASGVAIGAVLGQIDDVGNEYVIAYASRTLKDAEKNYATIELECLAIMFAVTKFRTYIWGKKTFVYTDHNPLQYLKNHRDTSSRLIRWSLKLQEYDLTICYRKGKANSNADALSRPPISETCLITNTVFTIVRQLNDFEKLKQYQQEDEEIQQIRKYLDYPELVHDTKIRNNLYKYEDNGILKYRQVLDALIFVPKILRETILLQYHDGTLGGHLSSKKTSSRIRQKYYWPELLQDVKNWCKTCQICQTRRNTGIKIKLPLKPMPVAAAPMEMIALDITGPFPLSLKGNSYILVMCDYLTKWPEAFAIPNHKANTIAKIFVEEIIFRYGVPKKLLTDRGTEFLSTLIKEINEYFGILKLNTTPYHPQTDGLVERFNYTLTSMLSSYVNSKQNDWDMHISSCLFAYRNAIHLGTGYTPFYLMYLRNTNMPVDLLFQPPLSQYMEQEDYLIIMKERMQEAWFKAGLNIKYNQENMKELYDKKHHDKQPKVGEYVMLESPVIIRGQSSKLTRTFKGPYLIEKVLDTSVILRDPKRPSKEAIMVHANRCKLIDNRNDQLRVIPKKDVDQSEIGKQSIRMALPNTQPLSEQRSNDKEFGNQINKPEESNEMIPKHKYNLRSNSIFSIMLITICLCITTSLAKENNTLLNITKVIKSHHIEINYIDGQIILIAVAKSIIIKSWVRPNAAIFLNINLLDKQDAYLIITNNSLDQQVNIEKIQEIYKIQLQITRNIKENQYHYKYVTEIKYIKSQIYMKKIQDDVLIKPEGKYYWEDIQYVIIFLKSRKRIIGQLSHGKLIPLYEQAFIVIFNKQILFRDEWTSMEIWRQEFNISNKSQLQSIKIKKNNTSIQRIPRHFFLKLLQVTNKTENSPRIKIKRKPLIYVEKSYNIDRPEEIQIITKKNPFIHFISITIIIIISTFLFIFILSFFCYIYVKCKQKTRLPESQLIYSVLL